MTVDAVADPVTTLLTKPGAPKSTSDKLDRLMIAAAQGHWGDRDRTKATKDSHIRWRPWLFGIVRVLLASLPVAVAIAGTIYLYRTNPSSPLLKAEVIAPILVAAIGVPTTILTSGARPGGSDPAGEAKVTRHFGRRRS